MWIRRSVKARSVSCSLVRLFSISVVLLTYHSTLDLRRRRGLATTRTPSRHQVCALNLSFYLTAWSSKDEHLRNPAKVMRLNSEMSIAATGPCAVSVRPPFLCLTLARCDAFYFSLRRGHPSSSFLRPGGPSQRPGHRPPRAES